MNPSAEKIKLKPLADKIENHIDPGIAVIIIRKVIEVYIYIYVYTYVYINYMYIHMYKMITIYIEA